MRGTSIALVSAVTGALLVPAVPLAADQPSAAPTAAIESASGSVPAGSAVKLDSSHSTGAIVRHLWDLDGNGSFETDSGPTAIVEVKPLAAGPLTVHVKVVDDQGQSAEAELELTVTPAPRMAAAVPRSPAPDPAASLPRVAQSPGGSAGVPRMVAANGIATAPARRKATVARKAARVHAAGSSGVTIKNFAFSPGSVSVHVGDTITWTNQDSAAHTATATNGSFDTGIIQKGKSGSHTFTSAGTISYICSVHPFMHGTVVVAAAAASGSTGGGGSSGSTSPTTPATPTTAAGLPQTGLNLVAVVLVAMLLMGSGMVLRRRVAREP
jgi:plastocyanin